MDACAVFQLQSVELLALRGGQGQGRKSPGASVVGGLGINWGMTAAEKRGREQRGNPKRTAGEVGGGEDLGVVSVGDQMDKIFGVSWQIQFSCFLYKCESRLGPCGCHGLCTSILVSPSRYMVGLHPPCL